MTIVTLEGNRFSLSGELPRVGSPAPSFTVVGSDLADVTLAGYEGKRLVLNVFPSLDTEVCARSVREFNRRAAALQDTAVLCVSADLPFAAGRFCTAEGIDHVATGSTFRSSFGRDYGVRIADGPLAGLNARAVIVVGADGMVEYTQLVPEITEEPNYDAVFEALERLGR